MWFFKCSFCIKTITYQLHILKVFNSAHFDSTYTKKPQKYFKECAFILIPGVGIPGCFELLAAADHDLPDALAEA